jgi:hypothetical protein
MEGFIMHLSQDIKAMKKNSLIIFLHLLNFYFLVGLACDNSNPNSIFNKKNNETKSKDMLCQTCVIFIDGTGSYKYISKAKKTAFYKIQCLPAGSKVYVRWITNNSILDDCSLISFIIPKKPTSPRNPFVNPMEKKKYRINLLKYKQLMTNIAVRIQKAQSPNARYTDIWGALFAASERFQYDSKNQPHLIMLTDMVDNTNRKYKNINLKRASVQILDYQVNPKQYERKQCWKKRLTSLGAATVEFAFLDDILIFK